MKNFSETHHLIPASHGVLELMVSEGEHANATLIVCHPHSQLGGTMDNKVVTTVVRALQSLNFNTIRFNFRSVGASTGVFDQGVGEQEDLVTVLHWAQQNFVAQKIMLAGFSFGAFVTLSFCQNYQPDLLLLIAPPTQYPGFEQLRLPQSKSMLIVAEADEIVSTPDILHWAKHQSFPLQEILVVPKASHFFHGQLVLLREAICTFTSENL